MQAVLEITKWETNFQPNHTYLLDSDKIHAFIPKGKTEPVYFKIPIRMDKRGRKFQELKINPFNTKTKSTLIEVKGSKGNSYWVDPDKGTCSCPGFSFRGKCKHVSLQ
jgi:hypothetical protein